MKTNAAFSLQGRDWWKVFLPYWIVIAAVEVCLQLAAIGRPWAGAHPGLAVLIQIVLSLALWVFGMIYTILFLRVIVPKLSFAGEGFDFQGKVGEFVWLNVVGILLTIVTLSVFLPWYLRRVLDYLASNTRYRGTE